MRTDDQKSANGLALIVGQACRLPGATSPDALWRLLIEGRSAISELPEERWPRDRYYHPRPGTPGKAYTFRAGIIDGVWDFDPRPFALSPREAQQMDPQQRLVLELVLEALADAGIRPSRLAGRRVGVFVGASTTDSTYRNVVDPAAGDGYFMTGNTLSLIANRVSHVLDLAGPSLTIDTACSSSLVAVDAARRAIGDGRVELAIVAGVNLLLSPFPFIGFSAARMLSPEGLCRSFGAGGQGYVRAEGGVAVVLAGRDQADAYGCRPHAVIVASAVNSDGRTTGIALPSRAAQAGLLAEVYGAGRLDPEHLAFMEAHGTGTRVGDPAEARAIGDVLGRPRRRPLPIGSIKSNIGHLEPAAGLAGLLKATLALEHDLLPATINAAEPSPDIAWAELNLELAGTPRRLDRRRDRLAGISAFGFGGTNAHVVIERPPDGRAVIRRRRKAPAAANVAPPVVVVSAHDGRALKGLAGSLAEAWHGETSLARLAGLVRDLLERRELMAERAVVVADTPAELTAELAGLARGSEAAASRPSARVARGRAVARQAAVGFVFSGNGSQWAGMGGAALKASPEFAAAFARIDEAFGRIAGWSLAGELASADLASRLADTAIGQPLLFAVQAATVDALAAGGLVADVVAGHSVGEIAAAYAAGALDLAAACRVIFERSRHQAPMRGAGRMAVVPLGAAAAGRLVVEVAADVEIAAINSDQAVTLVGPLDALEAVLAAAAAGGHGGQLLDIEYPFHSRLLDGLEGPLVGALSGLAPSPGRAKIVSTVTGGPIEGGRLTADHWWRNVREPVRFEAAVNAMLDLGAEVLVEIGPRPVLAAYLADIVRGRRGAVEVVASLGRRDGTDVDPIRMTMARAIAAGARFDADRAIGPPAEDWRGLPAYPFTRETLQSPPTVEADVPITAERHQPGGRHPWLGWQEKPGQPVWLMHLDCEVEPWLADHRVGGAVWLAGAALVDLMLAAGRTLADGDDVAVGGIEISRPLIIPREGMVEVRTAIEPASGRIEIASRRRLSSEPWSVHAVGHLETVATGRRQPASVPLPPAASAIDPAHFYSRARALGLDYGPAFRCLAGAGRHPDGRLHVGLTTRARPPGHGGREPCLEPTLVDAAFQGLLAITATTADGTGTAFVPVRFERAHLERAGVPPAAALITVERATTESLLADIDLIAADGARVARLEGARFRAVELRQRPDLERIACHIAGEPKGAARAIAAAGVPVADAAGSLRALTGPAVEPSLLLEAAAQRAAYDVLARSGAAVGQAGDGPSSIRAGLEAIAGQGGLLAGSGGEARLVAPCPLPPLAEIVRTLVAEHPAWADAAALASMVGEWTIDDGATPTGGAAATDTAPDRLAVALATARAAAVIGADGDRSRRVLTAGPARSRLARVLAGLGGAAGRLEITAVDAARLEEGAEAAIAGGGQGLAVIAGGLGQLADPVGALRAIRRALSVGGRLVLAEPTAGALSGLAALARGGHAVSMRRAAEWEPMLEAAGFTAVAAVPLEPGLALALYEAAAGTESGRAAADQPTARRALPATGCRVLGVGEGRLAERLAAAAGASGSWQRDRRAGGARAAVANNAPDFIVVVEPGGLGPSHAIADLAAALAAEAAGGGPAGRRVVLVAPGAVRAALGLGRPEPLAAAAWSLARTLQNEAPGLRIDLIDLDAALPEAALAERIVDWLAVEAAEREVVLTASGPVALRVRTGLPAPVAAGRPAEAAGLAIGRRGSLDRLAWRQRRRRPPAAGEVEIAVSAAGLNFRDVMWALGLLPPEALEDGFAGATIGFECAGEIIAVGAGVAGLGLGDPVIAMAPAAIASHVTVSAQAVARVPAGLTPAKAATLPVAALTALYALDRCARLAAGEWLLVHGGAGGVGLAALQIALRRGARVIATAGREDKRALLRALGAEHVLSSRSLAFHDEVRRLVPAGVDVVLNSLAGEAMEQSLALVRPFGRFVELGKRDFYANTRIGLRPFRNNVSYHGVDVDQLLSQAPATAKALMDEIGAMIAEGSLAPLPYQSFAAGEVVDAFRLMQQSGHIGKIVIEPPALPSHLVEPQSVPFRAAGDGVHVIIGGLGGFGLRTAEWLADSGARALALVSRSGAPRAVDGEVLERLRRRGVEIAAVACDAADRVALARTLAGIRAGRPIRGVVHAAMVLDDGALANQTRERMAPVIAAKVAIADNLDALTADDRLDYFLLYSSIAALIGNPGQAAYAAANGYLEGLARRRVADGRPALAVGWGPIADAGYLARNGAVLARLGERTSAIAMTAAEALAALGEVMVRGSAGAGGAVVTIGELGSWAGAARLPVLASPTFSKLADLGRQSAAASDRPVDLAALVAGLDGSAALARVVAAIRPVLASVLKLEAESLDAGRPLSELGVDSLITVELGLEIEQRLGVDLAASAISVGATLKDLAVHILRRVAPKASAAQPAEGRPVDEALALLRRHTSGLPVDADLAPVLNEVEDRRQRLQKVL